MLNNERIGINFMWKYVRRLIKYQKDENGVDTVTFPLYKYTIEHHQMKFSFISSSSAILCRHNSVTQLRVPDLTISLSLLFFFFFIPFPLTHPTIDRF